MTTPTPEQFGFTTETVASLTQEKAQRDKWRKTLCVVPCVGLCIIAGITLYFSILPWKNSLGALDLFGFLITVAWIVGLGFGAGLIIGFALLRVLHTFLHDPLRYKTLARYLEAVVQYEAWFIRTQKAFWKRLTGREFESEVTNLLNRAGYRARLTPASGDGGVDIILGDGTIVQCKAHRAQHLLKSCGSCMAHSPIKTPQRPCLFH